MIIEEREEMQLERKGDEEILVHTLSTGTQISFSEFGWYQASRKLTPPEMGESNRLLFKLLKKGLEHESDSL